MRNLKSLLGAAALLGVALLALAFVGARNTLTCSRRTGACEHVTDTFLRRTRESFPLSTLTGAEARRYSRNSSHLVLLTSAGDRSFTGYGTGVGTDRMDDNAAALTRFLRSSEETVEVSQDDRWISVLVAVFPLGFAIGLARGAVLRLLRD